MKNIFNSLLVATLLTWTVNADAGSELVYGKWAKSFTQNGFSLLMVLEIKEASTKVTNKCTYKGQSVLVSVEVPSQVTDTEYQILASAQNEVSKNGLDCNVSAETSTSNYVASKTHLKLTSGNEAIVLKRVK